MTTKLYSNRSLCYLRKLVAAGVVLLTAGIAQAAEPLPFNETFDTPEGFARFTVNNANGDDVTWVHDAFEKLAKYTYSAANDADDYLFTPGFALKADCRYVLTYKRCKRNYSSRERLAVTIGKTLSPADHSPIVEGDDHVAEVTPTEQRVEFRVPADGIYYIGFHCLSPKDLYYVKLDDVSLVEMLDIPVPAAVGDLTAEPAPEGRLSAHISFTVPEKDAEGGDVQHLVSAELSCSGVNTPIKQWTDITPGQKLEFDDQPYYAGKYTYTVVVKNQGGSSAEASCSVYIGQDKPYAVTDVKAVENEDQSVTVTWAAPTSETGVNGGYAPADKLLYTVKDNLGRTVAEKIESLCFVDGNVPYSEYQPQQVLSYTVYAVNGLQTSDPADSYPIVAGTPYEAPAEESFMYATTYYFPWYGENMFTERGSYWQAVTYGASPRADAYDDDAGLITYRSLAAPAGVSERFCSPKFNISALKHPAVSFAMYHTTSAYDTDKVHLEVSVDGGEFTQVGEDIQLGNPEGEAGWQLHRYLLDSFEGANTIRIALVGTGAQGHNMHFDVIRIYDDLVDFVPVEVTHSEPVLPGKAFQISGKVLNNGTKVSEKPVLVTLSNENGELESLTLDAPLPGETVEFSFSVTEPATKAGKELSYTVAIANEDDEKDDNNESSFTVECTMPPYPAVTNLNAAVEGQKVTLSWTAAETYKDYPVTVDGFESYEPFIINGVGPWKFVDVDGMATGENEDAENPYPNAEMPMAYQVYNPEQAGIDLEGWWGKDWVTFEGSQYLASMYNADNSTPNDDWLISPAISPAKPVSFMARSLTNGYKKETFEIYYSTTGDNIEDFELLASDACPAEWLEYKYYLPNDAKYFAIRHTTPVAYCLMIDNLSCAMLSSTPAEEAPEGYNVYRDNELIATVDGTTFEDLAPEADKDYEYAVSTKFAEGESGTAAVAVHTEESTGIEDITANSAVAYGLNGNIVVVTDHACCLAVYDMVGRTVFAGEITAGKHVRATAQGVYVVKVGNDTFKVAVK